MDNDEECDFRLILSLREKGGLSRDILHRIAKRHDLNLLFTCLCIGCDQKVRDNEGKLFSDYLARWEYKYITQRHRAWCIGKVLVNVYKDTFEGYIPNGFSRSGRPMLPMIWEHNLGVDRLARILESGVDLSHPQICQASPPPEYAAVLARYGWVPDKVDEKIQQELDMYYPPALWTPEARRMTFTTIPIPKVPSLFNQTIVAISDTHWEHRKLHIPGGEILICAGDLCMPWHKDITDYLMWMGDQTHPYKILVTGNHDKLFQNNKAKYLEICKEQGIIYLEDSGIEINGLKIWGSPWTPKRPRNKNNAFTLPRSELIRKWNMIPSDVDVLITHCPPYAIGDGNTDYYKGPPHRGGSLGLRKTINRLPNLKLHIFGHQHFGRGLYKGSNEVYFANCALEHDPTAFVFT